MIVKHFPTGLIGLDLVSVQPMKGPKIDLKYLDFVYIDKLKERRLKIEKIKSKICHPPISDDL
jgi:hypothetical protein